MIPVKKSKKWVVVFFLYALFIFAALFITRILIDHDFAYQDLTGFLLLSLCSAFIPCIGGYLGRYVFFCIYSLSVLAGLIYAFYVAIGDIAPGWGSLTSIIGFLFIVIIGIVIATIAEIITYVIKHRKS